MSSQENGIPGRKAAFARRVDYRRTWPEPTSMAQASSRPWCPSSRSGTTAAHIAGMAAHPGLRNVPMAGMRMPIQQGNVASILSRRTGLPGMVALAKFPIVPRIHRQAADQPRKCAARVMFSRRN